MATAKQVAKPIIPAKPEVNIVLTLTEEEAIFLMAVMVSVGGAPKISPRKHSDAIETALGTTGIYLHHPKVREVLGLLGTPSSIYFNNY
jgi:hypothetical protein